MCTDDKLDFCYAFFFSLGGKFTDVHRLRSLGCVSLKSFFSRLM